ncbi:histidine phosphatase family protein [Paracoccus sp. (in: a-proteobacteria)]|uniref:histidine phosphatase family protein n=1 Tax=Paracoccus sp. TaxID=267 RepID=UPI00396CE9B5
MSLFDHTRFHILRHGQTAMNAAGLIGGSSDVPLSDLGQRQARFAAQAWQDLPIGRLITSPLLRARQTAEAVAALRPDLTLEDAPPLAERDWGLWEGQPRAMLVRDATPPGGEAPDAFRDRIRAGVMAIPAPGTAEAPPLIVAHSGTAREIFALLDLPFLRPQNGTLITLTRDVAGTWWARPPRHAPETSPSNRKRIA